MTRLISISWAAWLGVTMLAAGVAHAQEVGLPLGATPDSVVIERLDGRPVSLNALLEGRPAVLEFWATWCPVCEALEPTLRAAHSRFGDRVAFIAVAVAVNQSKRSIRRHLEQKPIPYPVLWDTEGRATRAFRAPTTGYVVILGADGRVAYTGVGEDQDLIEALERVVER